jgi:ribosomal protein S18 acetylase RimI-like enzyme
MIEQPYKYEKVNFLNSFKLLAFLKNNRDCIEYFNPHPFTLKQIFKNILSKDFFVIQLSGKKITGYGLLRGWEEGYAIPSLGIMLDKKYRGIGLSKCLMEYLHQIAKQKGAKEVMLRVKNNNDKAINLYKSFEYNIQPYDHKFLMGFKKLN